jgi:hypothetical protein
MAYAQIKANAKGGGKDFEPVPAGVHFAICNKVIYLGFQAEEWEGKEKVLPKVWIGFELPDNKIDWVDKKGDKHEAPMVVGRMFTLNIGDKSNLGPFLTSWRGKPFTDEEREAFNITALAGKPCQLSIIHKKSGDKTYANIAGAMGLSQETKAAIKAGTRTVTPFGEVVVYSPDEHDQKMWELVPEWLQTKIHDRVVEEPVAAESQANPTTEDFDDDIPF